jgi:hypothetical protein
MLNIGHVKPTKEQPSDESRKKTFSFSILDILSKHQAPAEKNKKTAAKSTHSQIEETDEDKNLSSDEIENILDYESANHSVLSDEYDHQEQDEMNTHEKDLDDDDYTDENENLSDGI